MPDAELLTSEAALRSLVPEWLALWARVPTATPFQSPLWLLAWWSAFGTGAPRVVAWRDRGRLVGVLPLYRLDQPGGSLVLPIGAGITDYLDALLDGACAAAPDLLAPLAALPDRDADCVLSELPPGSPLIEAPPPASWATESWRGDSCPILALPARPDALRAVVPKVTLRNVHQARTRASRRGPVEVVHADAASATAALEVLLALHAKRWHDRGEPGVLADPRVQAFHRAAVPELARAGLLRFITLRVAGQPVAAYYGLAANRRAFAYMAGFDPDFPRESPGSLVIAEAIAAALAEGAVEFHFLRGREPYKYAWGAVDRINCGRRLRRAGGGARAA